MIIYMEATIALINGMPNGDLKNSWLQHLDQRLQFVQGNEVAYYKFIEK